MQRLVGRRLGPSDWRAVDQDQIDRFAALTGDDQWIHVDPARSRADGTFGGTIAQGNFILALAEPLVDEILDDSAFEVAMHRGWRDVRYDATVAAGDRIRAFVEVREVRELGGGWCEIVREITVEAEWHERPACVGRSVVALLDHATA